MDISSLEAKKQQLSQRYDELNQVINGAQIEQQQLTGAYQLADSLIKELDGARSGKAKNGRPKPTGSV